MKMISRGDSGEEGLSHVYLHGGRVHVAVEKCLITTIVVSSVAVGLWDIAKGVGGMNHYMLPMAIGGGVATPRFASTAMNDLLEKVFAAGASRERLRAKIFGGALHANGEINSAMLRDLGHRNADVARARLSAEGIPIVEERLGGNHGRKITFRTHDGWSEVMDMSR